MQLDHPSLGALPLRDKVMLRGTLMGLRRDRSGYVVPRSAVVIVAGLVSGGLLPLVMVERGYWRWSRGEQVKLQATARSFALFDDTASPVIRSSDDFAARREPRLPVYLALLLGVVLAGLLAVAAPDGPTPWWHAGGWWWVLAGLALTLPASLLLSWRVLRHARESAAVVNELGAWQLARERRPVRGRSVWLPDGLLFGLGLLALLCGLSGVGLGWLVAGIWRGYVIGVSLPVRQELADRLEEAAGLSHDPAHATLAPPEV